MTHQATDTASAALLKLAESWENEAEALRFNVGESGRVSANRHHARELRALVASLPAPAAPETDRVEDKTPLPPDVLADALQDRITPTSGRLRGAVAVKRAPAAPEDGAGIFKAERSTSIFAAAPEEEKP